MRFYKVCGWIMSVIFSAPSLNAAEPAADVIHIVSPSFYADREGYGANTSAPDARAQEVFPAGDFSSLPPNYRFITQMAWRPDGSLRQPLTFTADRWHIRLSTTTASPPDLSRTYAENTGPDELTVFDGPICVTTENLGPAAGPKEFDGIIVFEQPFYYDPNQGNLLMDAQIYGASATSMDILPDASSKLQFIWNENPDSGTATWEGGGIIWQFTFVAGPAGDFDGNASLDIDDLNLLIAEILAPTPKPRFDLNDDQFVSELDLQTWVHDLKSTWLGDANLDGEFNSSDMVSVLQAGRYETGEDAGWAEGDWNGDGVFGTADLVRALEDGGYEMGLRKNPEAVPEPAGALLLILGVLVAFIRRRRTTTLLASF